ncbi:chitinase 3 [Magnaporthiopsis poae ATCC 64411]|uniref:Chitinase 3 n=1 Tax=Magnaporthiopsis poae (strain ATCC 64411 / 73-15) TaxID=644358 RepID=A0A0C4DNN0_MAGP6|nr:chitinase 3 [Magnaporthiopsis poae ATCC 64411]
MRPTSIPWLATLLAVSSLALPLNDAVDTLPVQTPPSPATLPRLAIYYQTTHDAVTGRPISMLPLITEKHIALTHLIVCTLHDATKGREVEFYNAQFYNGFGDMASTEGFDSVVAAGYDPRRIMAGQVTTPENGWQWTPFDELARTMGELRRKYGEIGGIMGWEYFNGKPGGEAKPWEWAQQITAILRPNKPVGLRVTREDAARLDAAWATSVSGRDTGNTSVAGADNLKPDVDYWAMVSE